MASLPSVSGLWLMPRLRQLESGEPKLRIELIIDHRENALAEDGLDLALRCGRGGIPRRISVRLFEEYCFPIAAPYLARAIGKRTRQSMLWPVDRALGGGFGAIKGLIGATLVFLAFSLVYDTVYGSGARRPDWLSDARTYPLLNASGEAISDFVAARRAKKPA